MEQADVFQFPERLHWVLKCPYEDILLGEYVVYESQRLEVVIYLFSKTV